MKSMKAFVLIAFLQAAISATVQNWFLMASAFVTIMGASAWAAVDWVMDYEKQRRQG